MSVETESVTAVASLLSVIVGAVIAIPGIRAFDRRRAQRKADADAAVAEAAAAASEASTVQVVDEIARTWIKLLQEQVDELRARLGMEVDNRRVLLEHVDVLEVHINEGKPPPPPAQPPLRWWHPAPQTAMNPPDA